MSAVKSGLNSIMDIYLLTKKNDGYLDQKLKYTIVVGVVLDATEQLKTKSGQNYQKLKLVDETWNCDSIPQKRPYLHLFNFLKSPDDLIHIESIGDRVILQGFNFKIFEEDELQSYKNKQHTSRIKVVRFSDNIHNNNEFDQVVQARVLALKEWTISYFSSKSLLTQSWFTAQQGQAFDLLLKIIQRNSNELILNDVDGQNYQLIVEEHSLRLKLHQVVKLREIKLDEDKNIIIDENSSILLVPECFFDVGQFNLGKIECMLEESELQKQEYCKLYFVQLVTRLSAGENLQLTPISNAFSLNNTQPLTKVVCQIIDIHPKRLSECLNIYNPKDNTSTTFQEIIDQKLSIEFDAIVTLYLNIGLYDLQDMQVPLKVYNTIIFEPQGKTNFFTENIQDINLQNFNKYEEQFNKKVEDLLSKSDHGRQCMLLLSHIEGEVNLIINTLF